MFRGAVVSDLFKNVKLVLLDRDGTLLDPVHYLHDPDQARLVNGSGDALQTLVKAGLRIAVVSNQSGVGRGMFPVQDVHRVHEKMSKLLEEFSVTLSSIHFCPHAPGDHCDCRKPSPRMLLDACREAGVDPAEAVMVGDSQVDIEAGRRAGMRTILVRTGYGEKVEMLSAVSPDATINSVADLPELLIPLR
jgi:D-glycero-D-manno-heptose 1,7-bisphosphate phosphatase